MVENVDRDGAAADNGLKPGDVILAVNRTEIEQRRAVQAHPGRPARGSMVMLLINRDGDEVYHPFCPA